MRVRSLAAPLALVAVLCLAAGCSSGGAEGAAAPTPEDPEKVTVAGDSISVGLGASLRQAVDADTEVKVIGEEGSGLARPDTFDHPARLEALAADFPPTVLVLSLGSNDAQDLTDASGTVVVPLADDDAWDAEYRARLEAAVTPFADTGTTVVWVGHVRTSDPQVAATNRRIHDLAAEVAAGHEHVQVEDLAELLGTGDDEVATRCLLPDGLHLTVACLDEASDALVPRLPVG